MIKRIINWIPLGLRNRNANEKIVEVEEGVKAIKIGIKKQNS